MNNSVLAGVIVGAIVVTAVGAVAANSGLNPLQDYATVLAVEPAYDVKRTPRAVCGQETVLQQEPVKVTETTEEGCVTVYDIERTAAGYDVTYELDGTERTVRMNHDPGDRIPVRDGEPLVSRS